MSAVHIMGTFAKDKRPNNGLEHIADKLVKDELSPVVCVCVVVPYRYTKLAGEELSPVVQVLAIEPVDGEDALRVRELLDKQRAARDQRPASETLFDAEGWARDKPANG